MLVLFLTGVFFVDRLLDLHSWREFGHLAELLAEKVKADRNRNTAQSNPAEQGPCPLNPEIVKHLSSEKGKAGRKTGSEKGVRRNGRSGT